VSEVGSLGRLLLKRLGQSDVIRNTSDVTPSVSKSDEVTRHTSDVIQSQTPVEADELAFMEKEVDVAELQNTLKSMFED
jgi:hypothetical protein